MHSTGSMRHVCINDIWFIGKICFLMKQMPTASAIPFGKSFDNQELLAMYNLSIINSLL